MVGLKFWCFITDLRLFARALFVRPLRSSLVTAIVSVSVLIQQKYFFIKNSAAKLAYYFAKYKLMPNFGLNSLALRLNNYELLIMNY